MYTCIYILHIYKYILHTVSHFPEAHLQLPSHWGHIPSITCPPPPLVLRLSSYQSVLLAYNPSCLCSGVYYFLLSELLILFLRQEHSLGTCSLEGEDFSS